MIRKLFVQVIESISITESSTTVDRDAALRLATAVLMVDVARADHIFEDSEFERVLQLVEHHFKLAPEEAAELEDRARAAAPNS